MPRICFSRESNFFTNNVLNPRIVLMPSFFYHVSIDFDRPDENAKDYLSSSSRIFSPLKRSSTPRPHSPYAKGSTTSLNHSDPSILNATTPLLSTHDWRTGQISLQSVDMVPSASVSPPARSSGARLSSELGQHDQNGFATKGRFEPSDIESEELGWGVVRLYRDSEETPGLYDELSSVKNGRYHKGSKYWQLGHSKGEDDVTFKDEDCTTLCILAVPSYMTPSDFLGFVSEKTREEVSHFRMVRTERSNRYMVLMKFRSGKRAREWRLEWNGKAFNDMESENCHVVFVKSIKFRAREVSSDSEASFPDMTNDPFTPAKTELKPVKTQSSTGPSTALKVKPMAPPTPSLVELPTCPVCLERMDESTGLLTIHCQHVFHCNCLTKWRGSGCPVCRYTQADLNKRTQDAEEDAALNECSVCRSDVNLWVCLICGNVGCGRYDAAHAHLHYKQTSHCFSMDLLTQRVWDYESDGYVHRIMQSKSDGKLVELPSASGNYDHSSTYDDSVPREKLDNMSMEYTHLITSQLDSQRTYFEDKLERAADKASRASKDAAAAAEAAEKAVAALSDLQLSHDNLTKHTLPLIEKERDRALRRAEKFEGMARKLEIEWREEKAMSTNLLERVETLDKEMEELKAVNEDLKEQNRDMTFFISGQAKLKDLGEDVQEGTLSLPEAQKGKKKGKGKKGGGGGTGESSTGA